MLSEKYLGMKHWSASQRSRKNCQLNHPVVVHLPHHALIAADVRRVPHAASAHRHALKNAKAQLAPLA